MKKRLFSAGLAAMLVLSVPAVTMAEGSQTIIEKKDETATHDVYATYKPVEEAPTVYAVDITWGSMEFTYYAPAITKTWDPKTHTYTEAAAQNGRWENAEGANKVSLTNCSNAALTATITAETINDGTNDYTGITAKVADMTLDLEDASIGATTEKAGTASTAFTTISLSGELKNENANKTTIGNVTVTIADKEAQP